jgi:hypothetical protein
MFESKPEFRYFFIILVLYSEHDPKSFCPIHFNTITMSVKEAAGTIKIHQCKGCIFPGPDGVPFANVIGIVHNYVTINLSKAFLVGIPY